MHEKPEYLTIIGSGPAGLTAAIYSARANLNPLCIEGLQAGGQLMITSEVENYPGFPDSVLGPTLMGHFRKQAERFGTRFFQGDLLQIDLSSRPFLLILSGKKEIKTESLIIATGAAAKWIGIPSEKKFMGKGVSACATCDGFFFKNTDVAVVGGGDTAMEEALFLTRFARSVSVIHRKNQLRASKIMQEKALKNPKIKFIWNSVIEEILGETGVTGVRLRNLETQDFQTLSVEGVFVAIGHEPNTHLFRSQLKCNSMGYLVPELGTSRTQIPGVFVAGDVADPVYRQAITAAGMGCMAAMDAERFLESVV